MKSRIHSVDTHEFDDGAVEFRVVTFGKVRECVVDYGDGERERVAPRKPVKDATFYTEHRFKKGIHKISIAILGEDNLVADRRIISWGK